MKYDLMFGYSKGAHSADGLVDIAVVLMAMVS